MEIIIFFCINLKNYTIKVTFSSSFGPPDVDVLGLEFERPDKPKMSDYEKTSNVKTKILTSHPHKKLRKLIS